MSTGIKYPYATTYRIALEVLEQLKPHCERIENSRLNLSQES